MYIPNSMKEKIAKTFYDKTINKLENQIIIDDEGDTVVEPGLLVEQIKCNVSFSMCQKIQEQYGLTYNINIAITTFTNVNLEIGDIIQYKNQNYKITDKMLNDSHCLLVGIYDRG